MSNVINMPSREQSPADALIETAAEPLSGVIILAVREDGHMLWKTTGLTDIQAIYLLSRATHALNTSLENGDASR